MDYTGLIVALMVAAILIALGAAAYFVFRSPAFWADVGAEFMKKAWPQLLVLLTKRNTPEVEAQMAECVRRGGRWDNFRKKCVENR